MARRFILNIEENVLISRFFLEGGGGGVEGEAF